MTHTGHRLVAAGMAAASALVLVACSTNEPAAETRSSEQASPDASATAASSDLLNPDDVPTGQDGTPRGGSIDPDTIETRDADQVATAFAATSYRYDALIDNSPADASRRAARFMTDELADSVTEPRPGGGGQQWIELAEHDGYSTTEVTAVEEAGAPPDSETEAFRQRHVAVTMHGTDDWTRQEQHSLFIHLVRSGPGALWQVDNLTNQ